MLGDSVRRVDVSPEDPLFERIGEIARSRRDPFFLSSSVHRAYSSQELTEAEAFCWSIESRFEPTGAECGTVYDLSSACPECGTGRVQQSVLRLDLSRIPKKDVAMSIGGEVVVSERFARSLQGMAATGLELRPVEDSRRRIRRPAQRRFQLVALPPPMPVRSPPTTFGKNPFDLDESGEYRCSLGHIAGLNRLTEVTLSRNDWSPDRDLTATREHTGWPSWHRIGSLLVPEPLWIISPRLYALIHDERITGSRVEVDFLR